MGRNMTEYLNKFIKENWKTLLFFAATGLVGGFFLGLFLLDSYPESIRQQIYDQGLNDVLLGLVCAVQYATYGIVLGAIGMILGEKTGLFKNEKALTKKALITASCVAVISGLSMILFDLLWFGRASDVIMDSYATKPTFAFIVGSVICGGVTEEVMLRLFMMTLAAFILHKIFGKGREMPSPVIIIVANVASSLLFAAGHLPTTAVLFGLTPLIVFRCFLLNGGIGILLGWLYQRYGLRYSMITHAGAHVVSKLIWILFI